MTIWIESAKMRCWGLRFSMIVLLLNSVAVSQETNQPTKKGLIETLRAIFPLLQANQFDQAAKHVVLPPGMDPSELSGLIRQKEISRAGIDLLEAEAKFGGATELFGAERAKHFANKMGVTDVDSVFGFNYRTAAATAEVLAFWDGRRFKLIRLDDVGKLIAAKGVDSNSGKKMPPKTTGAVQPDLAQLRSAAEAAPKDVNALARYAQGLFQAGSYPESWKQIAAAYELEPNKSGTERGINALINKFSLMGMFSVGVPSETVLGVMGEPRQKVDLGSRNRWVYAHWGIDFKDDKVHEIVNLRGATKELYQPSEILKVDLDGRSWRTGFRRKMAGKVTAFWYVLGEMPQQWNEEIVIERILNVSNQGNAKELAERQIADEQKILPGVRHKILESDETTAIIATSIDGSDQRVGQQKLVKLMKGPTDLHRITYTVKSNELPSQQEQEKWLDIFRKAKLLPLNR